MYAVWWLVIGFGVLFVLGFVLVVVAKEGADGLIACGLVLFVSMGSGFIISLPFAIADPIAAKKEVAKYKQSYTMIEQVVEHGSGFENISITQTIIEYNSWLSEARADKETFGWFSRYCYENLDELQYIFAQGEIAP